MQLNLATREYTGNDRHRPACGMPRSTANLRRRRVRACGLGALAVAAIVVGAAPLQARGIDRAIDQSDVGDTDGPDARWTPWMGCWELVEERLAEDAAAADDDSQVADGVPAAARVCLSPAASGNGVVRRTIVGGRTVVEEDVVADGTDRSFGAPGCAGRERAEWSSNGLRLFTSAELRCEGQPRWRASGLSLIAPGPRWLDVQLIDEGSRRSMRVRRYRSTTNQDGTPATHPPSPTGAAPAGRDIDLDEVVEMAANVPIEVLQAALLETRPSFPLSARRLIELQRAGVSAALIDVMVALSFPKQFAVERAGSGGASPGPVAGWYDPYGWISFYSFGSPFWAFGGGEWVVIDGGGTAPPDDGRGSGRVVDGRGYTRVRPLDTGSARRSGGAGSTGGGTSGSTASTSDSSSGGSSSGVSSSGYSGGGSGDGARTAVPR